MQLEPGKTWVLQVPGNTQSGRVWARTGCSFDGPGKKSCQTGDCGGVLACTTSGQPPMTMAEFTLSDSNNMDDYFDITVVDGFNLPMDFLPVPSSKGSSGCSRGPRCAADITSQCPDELKVPGGCRSACNGSSCDASTEQITRSFSVPPSILCHCLHLQLHHCLRLQLHLLQQMEQAASHPHQNPRGQEYLVMF